MEKLAYLLFVDENQDGDALREALSHDAAARLREAGASGLRLSVQDSAVATGSPLRHRDPPMRAMMTFWLDAIDTRSSCEAALAAHANSIAGYLVTESSVMVPPREAGKRTEGMNQVTCIAKRKDISDEEFRSIWHDDHKKVAIETQSTFGYTRNVIVHALTEDAPTCWEAIVEETFPIGALTDLKVFYDAADDAELEANMKVMMTSCQRFLDLEPLEFCHMSEYPLD
jgi:hypothetical protein